MKKQINHGFRSLKSRLSLVLALLLVAVAALVAPARATGPTEPEKSAQHVTGGRHDIIWGHIDPDDGLCKEGETHGPGRCIFIFW